MTDLADRFYQLHARAGMLRLPNAWDAGSARLIAGLGAQAIATTSAGVAWANGYRDGNALPMDIHVASVRAMARVVGVPLSVDVENGYAADAVAVAENVARFMDVGAVGINIQDGIDTPAAVCRKIDAVRAVAARAGVRLYINVRTDIYLLDGVPPGRKVAEALERAARYRAAGADGLFVLGVTSNPEIAAIAAGTPLFLNVIAWPGLAPVPELASLGVKRVSAGSWIPQTLWARTAALAGAFLADGRSEPLVEHAAAYGEVNASF